MSQHDMIHEVLCVLLTVTIDPTLAAGGGVRRSVGRVLGGAGASRGGVRQAARDLRGAGCQRLQTYRWTAWGTPTPIIYEGVSDLHT